ncbi:uncharacterized protein LOC132785947 isoform X1 [Drosophila nasuta]|uniref:uncharacterized protein LOC132785947 isoform X1 n=1 Tax=Drosophila nasuta TaxID=42062 RepID=UPI00295EEA33|nr:uncharacterized protein LOC132785947 isoform X1 [Drosophila nasuta]
MRASPILGLLICIAIIVNMAEAKPIFIKVFAPSSGYSYQAAPAPTLSPAGSQLISSIITQKLNLLDSFLRAKSSFGSFGITKTISFSGPTTTTTEKTVTEQTTEVNTDFIPDVSSSTQSVPTTTTTEDDLKTPQPTVHPLKPVTTTSSPVIPPVVTKSTTTTTEAYSVETTTSGYTYSTPSTDGYTYGTSSTEDHSLVTSTDGTHGYSYQTPTRNPSSNTISPYYLPSS